MPTFSFGIEGPSGADSGLCLSDAKLTERSKGALFSRGVQERLKPPVGFQGVNSLEANQYCAFFGLNCI